MQSHGFELLHEEELRELSGRARLWRHTGSGAQLLSVCNKDENKCFGVTFRTPPKDSSGVAHILEHSVLCGSERFPVREPFVELLKGSLQTFLNAFTFPDKTCYPVAGTNLQDFYNLVDVYLDAVFHPRITKDIFLQEGRHTAAEEGVAWSYQGVVYNEMKGVYSSPESVLGEQSQQAVFPDMLYCLDSGGNPQNILELSYERFKAFHETYYHPSNARLFFWGDDPEERRLALLEAELSRYSVRKADSAVPLQPRRESPRLIEHAYASGEDGAARSMCTVNWLLCESGASEEVLAFEMLEHILLGLPGSPLRRALIESGLGEDLAGVGLETDLRQLYFSVGLKGMEAAALPEVESLIFNTLAELEQEGIAPEAMKAAVNSTEFALRENNSGRFPRGLSAMLRSLTTWLYEGDPLAPLRYEAPLAAIKQRLARGERLFEALIKKYFLENSHRATVLLTPDAELAGQREAAEHARLEAERAACSAEEQAALIAATDDLRRIQSTPDSPEALATIPGLTLADLPRENAAIPSEDRRAGILDVLFHDLDTSGIAYVELLLPLAAAPQRLLPLVPLFARSLTETATARRDFAALGMRIAAETGGLDAAPFFSARLGERNALAFLAISGKATEETIQDLFDILMEILFEPGAEQEERFTQMLLEEKARLENALIPGGHGFISSRLRARFHQAAWLGELTGGIAYLDAVRDLAVEAESGAYRSLRDMRSLREPLLRGGALLNLTCPKSLAGRILLLAERFAEKMPTAAAITNAADRHCPPLPPAEALCLPAQVNYVGKAADLYTLGYCYHGSANVILRHLRMAYLWERVRVQGGAYGAFCSFDRLSGTLAFLSYRDPHTARTLDVYDGAAAYLSKLKLDERELTRAIIGAIGEIDGYMLPDAKGSASLARRLSGMTETVRQQMREEILGTKLKDFHAFADVLAQVRQHGQICALGGAKVEELARKRDWAIKKLL